MRLAIFCLGPWLLAAQYYPVPYPSRPRIVGNTRSTGGVNQQPAVTFHGTLKQISNKEIVIETDEQQEVSIHRSRKTRFLKEDKEVKPAEVAPGTVVTLDVTKAPDATLMALNLFVDPPKKDQKADAGK